MRKLLFLSNSFDLMFMAGLLCVSWLLQRHACCGWHNSYKFHVGCSCGGLVALVLNASKREGQILIYGLPRHVAFLWHSSPNVLFGVSVWSTFLCGVLS